MTLRVTVVKSLNLIMLADGPDPETTVQQM